MPELKRFQEGDTIIEVMIALAVLGLAFALSYATANRALQVSRNSQEHSEALQYLNSQVELVRADASDSALYDTSHTLCMDSNPGDATFGKPVTSTNPACSIGTVPYQVSYTYSPDKDSNGVNQDVFTFAVTWPGLGQLGQQNENMSYKIHQPTIGVTGGGLGPGGSVGSGVPAPSITLAATPSSFIYSWFGPKTSTLTWSTLNASTCTAGGGTWSGPQSTSGSWTPGALNKSTTYTLSCSGSGGTTSKSVTVTVFCPPLYRSWGLCSG